MIRGRRPDPAVAQRVEEQRARQPVLQAAGGMGRLVLEIEGRCPGAPAARPGSDACRPSGRYRPRSARSPRSPTRGRSWHHPPARRVPAPPLCQHAGRPVKRAVGVKQGSLGSRRVRSDHVGFARTRRVRSDASGSLGRVGFARTRRVRSDASGSLGSRRVRSDASGSLGRVGFARTRRVRSVTSGSLGCGTCRISSRMIAA